MRTKTFTDMLNNAQVIPTLPATDLERAKKFYEQKLGLKTLQTFDGEIIMDTGNGNTLSIYKREKPTKADHTVLTFEVSDIESEVMDLANKGIQFEDPNLPGMKTRGFIAVKGNAKSAWFKDSEGNILCIHENIKI